MTAHPNKEYKMLRKVLATATAIASLNAPLVMGLGLGSVDLKSSLNEPLAAEIKVKDVDQLKGKMFRIGLASERAFAFSGIDRTALLGKLRFELIEERGVILVSSREPVTESYLNFLLEIAWDTNSITREYTFLLDLPALATEASPAVVSSGTTKPVKPVIKKLGTELKMTKPVVKVKMPPRDIDDGEYEVKNADTLWAVAREARPNKDVSIEAMVDAIYDANPDAFVNGNRDKLMRGAILVIPREVDTRQAVKRDAAVGSVAKLTPKSKPATTEAALTVVADDSARSVQLAEQVDALENEKAQLVDQLSALEEQNSAMNALLEAQSAEMARLQALVDSQEQIAQEEADAALLEDEAVVVETQAETAMADIAQPQTEAAVELVEDTAEPVVAAVEEAPKQQLVIAKQPQAAWYAKPMWWAIGGAGALIALALLLRARKRKAEEEAEIDAALAPVEASDDVKGILAEARKDGFDDGEVDLDINDESLETSLADYYESVDQEGAEEAPEDAVAAAEGYLAFEQYEQARDVLETALEQDEANNEVRLKLLEVLSIIGDHDAFDEHSDVLNIANDEQIETHIEALRASMPEREVDETLALDVSTEESTAQESDVDLFVEIEETLEVTEDAAGDISAELDVVEPADNATELSDVELTDTASEYDVVEADDAATEFASVVAEDEAEELSELDEEPLVGRAAALASGLSEEDLTLDLASIYALNEADAIVDQADSDEELDETIESGASFAAQYLPEEPEVEGATESTEGASEQQEELIDGPAAEIAPVSSGLADDELVELNFSVQYTAADNDQDATPVAAEPETSASSIPSPDEFVLAVEQDGPIEDTAANETAVDDMGALEFDLSDDSSNEHQDLEKLSGEESQLSFDDGVEFVTEDLNVPAKEETTEAWTTDDEYVSGLDDSFVEESSNGLSLADENELAAIEGLDSSESVSPELDLESDLAELESLNDLDGLDEISDGFSDLDAELQLSSEDISEDIAFELDDHTEEASKDIEIQLESFSEETESDRSIDDYTAEISELNSNLGDAVQREIDEADVTIEAPKDVSLLEGVDEIATKIDLARAYLDMDDVDGAIELLEEVVAEAEGELQAEAKSLLDSL